ncbi:hypothetical protein F5878DRAFT_722206 [Lentinula raphanica]|uniref:Uncharacterized protein n=1 Tax=Lentinula raphanica TaxID=153919 RepID=A0AA38PH54_9AGAR|nr:hypothetical protein F5880DRAFT_1249499 [Lentinula raphanica]KAJ3842451.1 hypothetical protein F5878DRAFT_722206 [Lentinula raphanica]
MTSSTPSTSSTQAPISIFIQYIPVLANHSAKLARFLFRLASSVTQATFLYPSALVLSPLAVLLSISLYILAPVTVFIQTLHNLLVLTPYHVVTYLLEAIYPVYVFCGVACITGAIVGILARQIVLYLIELGRLDEAGRHSQEEQSPELVAEKVEWEAA